METLEKKLIFQIDKLKKEFSSDDKVIQYEKTSLEFDYLVKIGLIKKRGNNLLSLSEFNLIEPVSFNADLQYKLKTD
jgi:hypothetical protein